MSSKFARAVASAGGLGYLPVAPGTAGSLVGWLLGMGWPVRDAAALHILAFGLLVVVGLAASTIAERASGLHDPGWIVIDEVLGMWLVLLLVPSAVGIGWQAVLAFALCRIFDIAKPPPLKWLSRFPGGWGIVLDDVGAGVYAALALWGLALLLNRPG